MHKIKICIFDVVRKGISNKRWPTYKYNYYPTTQAPRTTQYPNYYPGTTRSYPGWMQDLLEMDQNE